jgi:hypothetical protein
VVGDFVSIGGMSLMVREIHGTFDSRSTGTWGGDMQFHQNGSL